MQIQVSLTSYEPERESKDKRITKNFTGEKEGKKGGPHWNAKKRGKAGGEKERVGVNVHQKKVRRT